MAIDLSDIRFLMTQNWEGAEEENDYEGDEDDVIGRHSPKPQLI